MKYNPRQNGVVERYVGETKRVLVKWLKGDVTGWECYVPAVQMGLNDRILSRHHSRPFSLMFGRRMNGFEAYTSTEEVEFDELSKEEWDALLLELKSWGKDIWEVVSKEGERVGEEHNKRGNKKQRRKN